MTPFSCTYLVVCRMSRTSSRTEPLRDLRLWNPFYRYVSLVILLDCSSTPLLLRLAQCICQLAPAELSLKQILTLEFLVVISYNYWLASYHIYNLIRNYSLVSRVSCGWHSYNFCSVSQKSSRAIMLSGSPALSRPVELFTQIASLNPRVIPDFFGFAKRYCDAKEVTKLFWCDVFIGSFLKCLQLSLGYQSWDRVSSICCQNPCLALLLIWKRGMEIHKKFTEVTPCI